MKTLEEEGLVENTLIIFTSDNGAMLNRGGQDAWKSGHHMNGKLLGFKFEAWEGGHRIPFIVRWPGKVPAGSTSDILLSNVDILATMAALTGYKLKDNDGPDSFNMLPAITGNPKKQIRDHIIICPFNKSHLSIRKDSWVYIPAQDAGGFGGKKIGDHDFGGSAAFQLTHYVNSDIKNAMIKTDAPKGQLYNKYPKIVKKLDKMLNEKVNKQKSTRK